MIELFVFPRKSYTLIVLEVVDFEPNDLAKMKMPEVDRTKGVAIAAAPETDLTAVGELFSYYRNRSQWQGAYNSAIFAGQRRPTKSGIVVGNAFGDSEQVKSDVIEAQLPCLQCYREQGLDEFIKPGAKRPYCEKHEDRSPHRRRSRRRR